MEWRTGVMVDWNGHIVLCTDKDSDGIRCYSSKHDVYVYREGRGFAVRVDCSKCGGIQLHCQVSSAKYSAKKNKVYATGRR